MWNDEILDEIRKIREEHAKSFNYDLDAICHDLRQQQAVSGRKIISTPLKKAHTLVPDKK
jgi:hypothetical protein